MTRMTKAGISTTQAGQEQYETFYSSHRGRRVSRVMYDYRTQDGELYSVVAHHRGRRVSRVMYDYRTQDGELYSVVAPSLRECRHKRDEWLAKRNK